MNNLHSHGLKELVLDLKEEEYAIGVSRDMAPIYTMGNKFNGYDKARPCAYIKKNIFELLDFKKDGDLTVVNDYDAIRIGDYVFTGDVKLIHIGVADHFMLVANKMIIAKYLERFFIS